MEVEEEVLLFGQVFARVVRRNTNRRKQISIYLTIFKEIAFGIIYPVTDMGIDCLTALTHFKNGNMGYFGLTLSFVALPGLIAGLVVVIRSAKKGFDLKKLFRNVAIIFIFPLVYPILQVMANALLVYLIYKFNSLDVMQVIGQNVKEFKSLEGFFESGPQFILQAYILLRGELPHFERVDSITADRAMILSASIFLSFLSLTKTGFNLNSPDPDENRIEKQCKDNAPFFWLTSILFHFVCVLFRVTTLAFLFAVFSFWTFIVVGFTLISNVIMLSISKLPFHISCLLGMLSILMPNGYLVYLFAGVFKVDMVEKFLSLHMCLVTFAFMFSSWLAMFLKDTKSVSTFLTEASFLQDENIYDGLVVLILLLGILSIVLCIVHFKLSIEKLYLRYAVDQTPVNRFSAFLQPIRI